MPATYARVLGDRELRIFGLWWRRRGDRKWRCSCGPLCRPCGTRGYSYTPSFPALTCRATIVPPGGLGILLDALYERAVTKKTTQGRCASLNGAPSRLLCWRSRITWATRPGPSSNNPYYFGCSLIFFRMRSNIPRGGRVDCSSCSRSVPYSCEASRKAALKPLLIANGGGV